MNIHMAFYSTASFITININFFMKSWNIEVMFKAVLTTFWCLLLGFPLFFFTLFLWLNPLTVGLQSLQPHYVTGRRKIDVLLCSLYIQHRRDEHLFVSYSLSLSLSLCTIGFTGITTCFLGEYLLFLVQFLVLGKSTGNNWIFIYLPLCTGSIIQWLCTESSNISLRLRCLAKTLY